MTWDSSRRNTPVRRRAGSGAAGGLPGVPEEEGGVGGGYSAVDVADPDAEVAEGGS